MNVIKAIVNSIITASVTWTIISFDLNYFIFLFIFGIFLEYITNSSKKINFFDLFTLFLFTFLFSYVLTDIWTNPFSYVCVFSGFIIKKLYNYLITS